MTATALTGGLAEQDTGYWSPVWFGVAEMLVATWTHRSALDSAEGERIARPWPCHSRRKPPQDDAGDTGPRGPPTLHLDAQ